MPAVDDSGLATRAKFSSILPNDVEDLLAYRRHKVQVISHLRLYADDYVPSTDVFGQTIDGKWNAESGFYISNPQLLLIVAPPKQITPITYWAPDENPPGEQAFLHDEQRIKVSYNDTSANHWLSWVSGYRGSGRFDLLAVNARDAGFQYAMLDMQQSKNVDSIYSGDITRRPIQLKDHFRYDSRFAAVGNYLAPANRAMAVSLMNDLEITKIYVKLWRQKPSRATDAEDYAYVIAVYPNPDANDYGDSDGDKEFESFVYWLNIGANVYLPLLFLALGFFIGRYQEKRHYKSIHRREQALLHIPAITSSTYDTTRDIEQIQLVYGSVAISVDYFKRLMAFFRHLVGGEVKAYSPLIDRARREAILRMKESYPDCHIFLNCRLQTSSITTGKRQRTTCVSVIAYATALRYKS